MLIFFLKEKEQEFIKLYLGSLFQKLQKWRMIQALLNDSLQKMSCGASLIRVPEVLGGPYNL